MNIPERVWSEDMGEISGFGGGYEATCRAMVFAGMDWFDQHPDAAPIFQGFKNIYGIIMEENQEAKDLTAAIVAPAQGDCTGAMHQASVSHCLAYKRLGWEAYCTQLREQEAQEKHQS